MNTPNEKNFFMEHGYLHVRGILNSEYLAFIQKEFDRVWELEKPHVSSNQFLNEPRVLKHKAFIELIEHPPILKRLYAIFGSQTQLLQYELSRQDPTSEVHWHWHRDFTFRGEWPLAINGLLYLDDMTEDQGPTRVVPGSHRGEVWPPQKSADEPLPGEVSIYADAGDALFINASIWHTGGHNRSGGLRRVVHPYYGYWWLKRYNWHLSPPWQALENAGEQRLRLLGVKMPDKDIHLYDQGYSISEFA